MITVGKSSQHIFRFDVVNAFGSGGYAMMFSINLKLCTFTSQTFPLKKPFHSRIEYIVYIIL